MAPSLPQGARGRWLRQQRDGIRFCALFALFTVLTFAALYVAEKRLVVPLNRHLAWMAEKCLRLVGVPATSAGPVVSMASFGVEIKNNCNAIYEIGLYAAAVWAYPASVRDHLRGTVMGAVVLYGVNLLRILTLLALGLLAPAWFGPTHLYAWQLIFLLVVAACWLGWIARVRPGG
jgi:exosortase/archaeosortase family protein